MIILLCGLLLTPFVQAIVFPVVLKGKWNPLSPSETQCPEDVESPALLDPPGTLMVTFTQFDLISSELAKGFFCQKNSWTTTCDYRWYGPTYLIKSWTKSKPTVDECNRAVDRYRMGDQFDRGYPPEECSWNNVISRSNEVVLVTSHATVVDHLSGDFLDSRLKSGRCSESPCQGIDESVIWTSKDKGSTTCKQVVQDRLRVYPESTQGPQESKIGKKSLVHSSFGPPFELGQMCRYKLCNRYGFRLPGGNWIDPDIPDGVRGQAFRSLGACPPGSSLRSSVFGKDIEISYQHRLLLSTERYMCLKTLQHYRETHKIAHWETPTLAQRHPGWGLVYMVWNNTLYGINGRYEEITALTVREEFNLTIESKTGNFYSLKEWHQDPEDSVKYLGPNGLEWKKGLLSLSGPLTEWAEEELEREETLYIHPVHPGHVEKLPLIHRNGTALIYQNSPRGDIVSNIKNWLGGWGDIAIIAVCILVFVGGVLLISWMPSCCRRFPAPRRRDRQIEHFEMY